MEPSPQLPERMHAALMDLRKRPIPKLLFVTHRIGGGVERHVNELCAITNANACVMVMRPGRLPGVIALSVPLACNGEARTELAYRLPAQEKDFRHLLLSLGVVRVHVHHLLGFPSSIPDMLISLNLPIDLTFHDHCVLFCDPNGNSVDGNVLREGALAQSLRLIADRAVRIIAPSSSLASDVSQQFPCWSILVRPHPEAELIGAYPAPEAPYIKEGQPMRILCLGNFTREKGAEVLAAVARLSAQRVESLEFLLLGRKMEPLPREVKQLGEYQDDELGDLISRLSPHVIWLPAQCAETWSYTLSAGLALGLPVVVSNVGAFPERLRGRPLSWLEPASSSALEWLQVLIRVRQYLLDKRYQVPTWNQPEAIAFYTGQKSRYLEPVMPAVFEGLPRLPEGLDESYALALCKPALWRRGLLKIARWARSQSFLTFMFRPIPRQWLKVMRRALGPE